MKCLNCGRRIPYGTEYELCKTSASCETVYDVEISKMKRQIFSMIRSLVVYMIIAGALYYWKPLAAAKWFGFAVFYFALVSTIFSGVLILAGYIRLRRQRGREMREKMPG